MRICSILSLILVFSGVLSAETANRLLSLVTHQSVAAPCDSPGDKDYPLPVGDTDWTVPLELEETAEHLQIDLEFTLCSHGVLLVVHSDTGTLTRDGVSPLSSYAAPLFLLQRFLI